MAANSGACYRAYGAELEGEYDVVEAGMAWGKAGAGPPVGKHILMSYLTPEHAVVGEQLSVEYMGERYPVTVAVTDSTPVFDPDNSRVRS
jgi:glycine cleavage system aminomethyltransferase T